MGPEKKSRPSSKSKKLAEDRGAGHVLITLDHGSGAVRISYDNVDMDHMAALTILLQKYIDGMVEEAKVLAIREQVRNEMEEQGCAGVKR